MKKLILTPPGRTAGDTYLTGGIASIILMSVASVSFHMRLDTAIDSLYYDRSVRAIGKRILIDGAMMPEIEEIFGNCFIGFWFLVIAAITTIVFNYLYFIGDAKPIYLMKRLPDRNAIHRMCLSGPILMLLAGIAVMLIIAYVDYQMYFLKPPAQRIPENDTDSILGLLWGAII